MCGWCRKLVFGFRAEAVHFAVEWHVCEFEMLVSLSGAVELAVIMRVCVFLPRHIGQHFVSPRMDAGFLCGETLGIDGGG